MEKRETLELFLGRKIDESVYKKIKDIVIADRCEKEAVNHPEHYQGTKFEAIDVIDDFELDFNLGNAVKYILRADRKGKREEDLKKAIWYLQRELSR